MTDVFGLVLICYDNICANFFSFKHMHISINPLKIPLANKLSKKMLRVSFQELAFAQQSIIKFIDCISPFCLSLRIYPPSYHSGPKHSLVHFQNLNIRRLAIADEANQSIPAAPARIEYSKNKIDFTIFPSRGCIE